MRNDRYDEETQTTRYLNECREIWVLWKSACFAFVKYTVESSVATFDINHSLRRFKELCFTDIKRVNSLYM